MAIAQGEWDVGLTITSSSPLQPLDTSRVTAQQLGLVITSTGLELSANCPAGYYCDGTDVWACPLNTFNPSAGKTSVNDCSQCPAYEVTNSTAQLACTICPAGTRLATSDSGPAPGNANRRCVACVPGSRATANTTDCFVCGPGTYAAVAGATCTPCPAGTYSSTAAATSCTSCPTGTYTFSQSTVDGALVYTPLTGMLYSSNCVKSPLHPQYGLVCLPGTYRDGGGCTPCTQGFYCSMMSYRDIQPSMIKCPDGTYSPQLYAKTAADCGSKSAPLVYTYTTCPISTGDISAITALNITAVCAPKDSDASVFLATATGVWRLLLQELILQPISTGTVVPTGISAIGVDQTVADEAHLLVVGDAGTHAVFLTNLDTMATTALGNIGRPGGIALRSHQQPGKTYTLLCSLLCIFW